MLGFTNSATNKRDGQRESDSQEARQQRDGKDTGTIVRYLLSRNPFETHGDQLMCIATGLISDKTTNVDEAKKIGGEILDGMTGVAVSAVHFKKQNEA